MSDDRKMKTLEVDAFEDMGQDQIDMPLSEALRQLQASAAEVPAEYREMATLYIWCDREDRVVYASIQWEVPETDEEMQARLLADKTAKERFLAYDEARERAILAALKAKYEPGQVN